MSNPTSNYSFQMPTSTDLVTDLPADFEVFGQAVDTRMKTNADAATQKATLTTTGDIYYASSASTPARLGIGTTGQLLSVSGGVPAWATVNAGGMTLLSTTTLSGATVTISSISQAYNSLIAVVYGTTNATADGQFNFRPNSSATISTHWGGTWNSGTGVASQGSGTDVCYLSAQINTSRTAATNCWTIRIDNYTSTTDWKSLSVNGVFTKTGGNLTSVGLSGGIQTTSAITSMQFLNAGGNLSTGTVLLYGVK